MLSGTLVTLSQYARETIPQFAKWYNDPDITYYMGMYVPFPLDLHEMGYERIARDSNTPCFLIYERQTGTLIGHIGAEINWKDRVATVGILIGETSFWDKGYGADSMAVLMKYVFVTLDMQRAELTTFDFNLRARKCFQKVGFKEEGKKGRSKWGNGEFRDVILMGLLRDEWKQKETEAKRERDEKTICMKK